MMMSKCCQLIDLEAKAATQRTSRMIELTYPVHVPNNQRKPRRLNDDEVTPLDKLDTHETFIDCPWCKKRTKTIVKRQSGATTQ